MWDRTKFMVVKGVPIYVNNEGEFSTPEDEVKGAPVQCLGLRAPTVVALRAKIDKALKAKFERFQIWTQGWRNQDVYKLVTVTSIMEHGAVWTIDSKRRREKLYNSDTLYLNTTKNRELVRAIEEHQRQVGVWEDRIKALEDQMDLWKRPKTSD